MKKYLKYQNINKYIKGNYLTGISNLCIKLPIEYIKVYKNSIQVFWKLPNSTFGDVLNSLL